MEITTFLVGFAFALILASLAVVPNLIRVFLDLRARREAATVTKLRTAFSNPVPFNYPQMVGSERHVAGKQTDGK
jgi:hypothetical protein